MWPPAGNSGRLTQPPKTATAETRDGNDLWSPQRAGPTGQRRPQMPGKFTDVQVNSAAVRDALVQDVSRKSHPGATQGLALSAPCIFIQQN
jgi:hypothetical protein